jgi:hypothetical protein
MELDTEAQMVASVLARKETRWSQLATAGADAPAIAQTRQSGKAGAAKCLPLDRIQPIEKKRSSRQG